MPRISEVGDGRRHPWETPPHPVAEAVLLIPAVAVLLALPGGLEVEWLDLLWRTPGGP